MNNILWRVVSITAVLAMIGIVVGLNMANTECGNSKYSGVEEARSAGAVAKGWVPDSLPHSAKDIQEQHCSDNNRINAAFRYDTAENLDLGKPCELISPAGKDHKVYWCRSKEAVTCLDLRPDGQGKATSDSKPECQKFVTN